MLVNYLIFSTYRGGGEKVMPTQCSPNVPGTLQKKSTYINYMLMQMVFILGKPLIKENDKEELDKNIIVVNDLGADDVHLADVNYIAYKDVNLVS